MKPIVLQPAPTTGLVRGDPVFLTYVGVFAATALVCFLSARRARRITDPDTRRGLYWLLVTSGGWALGHLGFFIAPSPALKTAFYLAGLIVGFAAVGPWLYFCSAYTGRSLHKLPLVRRTAVGIFAVVVLLKVTNPLHGLYFTTAVATTPFVHLSVQNGTLHWLVMGLSYALASVGLFMLFELFMQVSTDMRPFYALVLITGLPIVPDVLATRTEALVEITYEPLGVAIFAVGVLYIYLDRFEAVQLASDRDGPMIVLSEEGRIRDFTREAADLFPSLSDGRVIGQPLEAVIPTIPDAVGPEGVILEIEVSGSPRFFRLTQTSFGSESTAAGRRLAFTDITHRERYRRELERQNERLEAFAGMVSHDLRNPLSVAKGRLEMAREEADTDNLAEIDAALERMTTIVEDVLALARQGQPVDESEPVVLADAAEDAWRMIDAGDVELRIEGDLTFEADPDRLANLLENLFRNAIEHGNTTTTVRVGPIRDPPGFSVADDGRGIPVGERETVFESGHTTAEDGTGFGLAIVREIADAHGWDIRATASEDGGARFEVTGVEPA